MINERKKNGRIILRIVMMRVKYPILNFDAKNNFENNVSLIVKYHENYNDICVYNIVSILNVFIFAPYSG